MKDLWRFYDGQVSGVVIALTEEEAKERAGTYLRTHFTDVDLRLMRVLLAVEANYDRFFDALTKNAEADYARVKMDAIMQNICPPEKFIPFEKRYEWLPEITYEPRK